MSSLSPDDAKGFKKAVRRSAAHTFASHTSRLQAGDPDYVVGRSQIRTFSLGAYCSVLFIFALLNDWCGRVIGLAIVAPLEGVSGAAALFGAIFLSFLAAFAFLRLSQAAIGALFDNSNAIEWPRQDVDWGKQAFVLDQDGIAIAHRLVRRTYRWDSMSELVEDDVFTIKRKKGSPVVIPKNPADEDSMRERLMRGISLSGRTRSKRG